MKLTISPKQVSRLLACIVGFLVLVNLGLKFIRYYLEHDYVHGLMPVVLRLFDTDGEGNIPAWYSSLALLLCSALLVFIATEESQENNRYATHWKGLAAIFLYMAVDEAVMIHELPSEPLHIALKTSGHLYYAWVIPYSVVVLAVALVYGPFVLALPSETRRLFLLGGALYVGGSIGMEMLGAAYHDAVGANNMTYMTISGIEEALEMTGVAVFVYALLRYLETRSCFLVLRIGGEK
jgi:hypothetical protein